MRANVDVFDFRRSSYEDDLREYAEKREKVKKKRRSRSRS